MTSVSWLFQFLPRPHGRSVETSKHTTHTCSLASALFDWFPFRNNELMLRGGTTNQEEVNTKQMAVSWEIPAQITKCLPALSLKPTPATWTVPIAESYWISPLCPSKSVQNGQIPEQTPSPLTGQLEVTSPLLCSRTLSAAVPEHWSSSCRFGPPHLKLNISPDSVAVHWTDSGGEGLRGNDLASGWTRGSGGGAGGEIVRNVNCHIFRANIILVWLTLVVFRARERVDLALSPTLQGRSRTSPTAHRTKEANAVKVTPLLPLLCDVTLRFLPGRRILQVVQWNQNCNQVNVGVICATQSGDRVSVVSASRLCGCTSTWSRVYTPAHTYTRTHVHTYTRTHTRAHTPAHAHTSAHIHTPSNLETHFNCMWVCELCQHSLFCEKGSFLHTARADFDSRGSCAKPARFYTEIEKQMICSEQILAPTITRCSTWILWMGAWRLHAACVNRPVVVNIRWFWFSFAAPQQTQFVVVFPWKVLRNAPVTHGIRQDQTTLRESSSLRFESDCTWDVRHETWDVRRETWDMRHETWDIRCETWDMRHEMWDMRHETWDVRCETWDVRHETWDVRHETWDVRRKMWDMRHETWDVRCETWDMRHETWDVRHETWDVRREMWDMRCETWDVRHETWDMRRETWDVRHEMWDVRHETWDMRHETWDVRRETWDVRRETWDMRRETWDVRRETQARCTTEQVEWTDPCRTRQAPHFEAQTLCVCVCVCVCVCEVGWG